MLESLRADLDAHRGSPDKTPARRLATLEAAGELAIPFTTGILVGIGEDRADRIEALEAIAAAHRRHGHVQEVIVQNFLPKPGTAMHAHPPCPRRRVPRRHRPGPADPAARRARPGPAEPVRRLRRAARRRHRRLGRRLPRHRRPREPRAAVARPRPPARGHRGARASCWPPASPLYPEFALDPERWLDAGLHFAVLDRQRRRGPRPRRSRRGVPREDRRGPQRRRRGRGRPRRPPLHAVVLRCRRRRRPPACPVRADGPRRRRRGARRRPRRARSWARTRSSPCSRPGAARSRPSPSSPTSCAPQAVGDAVTWVPNRNINYTNVCTFKCRFCGFSKGPLSLNLRGKPYLLTLDDIAERVRRGRGTSAPPRSACRAASTPTSTATTTSTSPGR